MACKRSGVRIPLPPPLKERTSPEGGVLLFLKRESGERAPQRGEWPAGCGWLSHHIAENPLDKTTLFCFALKRFEASNWFNRPVGASRRECAAERGRSARNVVAHSLWRSGLRLDCQSGQTPRVGNRCSQCLMESLACGKKD